MTHMTKRRSAITAIAVCLVGLCGAPPAGAVEATGSTDAGTLAAALVGGGVTISNATLTAGDGSAGAFSGGGSAVGFDDGVVLSSGDVSLVAGPNTTTGAGAVMGTPGDPDLSALIDGVATLDAAVLEFDFVPSTPTLRFTYAFGSEEYNEYVGQFNDVFGLFVNGVNCAIVPGTANTPVSINSVNLNTNEAYYRDNDLASGPPALDIQFDGMTVPLQCMAPVVVGQTNHLKLAVADALDRVLDSAVFIKADSVTALPEIRMSAPTVSTPESGTLQVSVALSAPAPAPVTVSFTTSDGTASSGSDYTATSGTLALPTGSTGGTIDIPISPDSSDEPNETFSVTLSSPTGATLGAAVTTVTIVDDDVPVTTSTSVAAAGTVRPASGGKVTSFDLSASDSNGAAAGGTRTGTASVISAKGSFVATSVTGAVWTSTAATITYMGTWKGAPGAKLVAKATDGSPDAISLTITLNGTVVHKVANVVLTGAVTLS